MKIIIRIEGWRQQDKKAIVKSIKGFVKSLAKRFGFQVEFDEINNDWIYRQIPTSPYLEKQLEAVEKALGFKLFVWQKTFIATGHFRQYGKTTAEILKDLLAIDDEPIDYSARAGNARAEFYREETKKIKEKLEADRIITRTVFFTKDEKNKYYREKRERECKREMDLTKQPKSIQQDILPEFRNWTW